MYFFSLVMKNLLRRPIRTMLTCTSMAIAVCAVVSMLSTSEGYEGAIAHMYESRDVDLIVVRTGVSQRVASSLEESTAERIRQLDYVRELEPVLVDLVSFEEAHLIAVYVFGLRIDGTMQGFLKVKEGRTLRADDHRKALLGNVLAKNLNKGVGDKVEIEGEPFEVVGIYDTFNMLESNGAVVALPELQKLMGREKQATTFLVFLKNQGDKTRAVENARLEIEALRDDKGNSLRLSVNSAQDHVKTTFETQMLKGFAWLSSTIALVIGLVSMLNTMMMSVSERFREIATLRAIGWKRLRVVRMILTEAAVLSFFGALLGVLVSIPFLYGLSHLSVTSAVVVSALHPAIMAKGLALGMIAGLIGACYPSVIASSLSPAQALRYE
jgi:putative ABC transport system permease protein